MSSTIHESKESIISKIVSISAENRFLLILLSLAIFVWGIISASSMPLDAIPDLSDTQVIIRTDWPGQAPQVIEDQVTFPLSSQMLGLPKTKDVRGFSMFGTSFVYVVFEDDVDMYWARSRVLESLSQISSQLPVGSVPKLGPDATGVGWVFQYALVDKKNTHDLQEIRSMQDWFVKYELTTIPGVAEVASVGGFVKEYQVLVDPNKLRALDISLPQVIDAVRNSNKETGGRTLEMTETEYLIRSFGYVKNIEDIKNAAISAKNGRPILVSDVARVIKGPSIRRGVSEYNGEGEAVGGIVVMRPGSNSVEVIKKVKEKLQFIQQGLPDGVELEVIYDRSKFIKGAVEYLKDKLIEESIMVVLVTVLFLWHLRSAFVAVITLPLGILLSFIIMKWQGITANIMSLGGIAIAIGAMVDASIVMVENAHKKLAKNPENRTKAIIDSAKEVGPGIFFSLLIITVSFIPIFALTGQSYKLFSPLAFTKTYAMAASCILSITIVPALMVLLLKGKIIKEEENIINRCLSYIYQPIISLALRYKKPTLAIAIISLISIAFPISKMGTEFMPPLYEGDILYMPMTLPGVSPSKVREILQVTNRSLMTIPEVKHVFAKAGRSTTATDPAPLPMIETWVELKPIESWRSGMTPEKLINEMNSTVQVPGMINSWGYPIKIRIDMINTGLRTPVGIKISGPDIKVIDKISKDIERIAKEVPGTRSAIADRIEGANYIEITPKRIEIARYGISIDTVQKVIQTALGGMMLSESIEGRERYPIMLRYDRPFREHISDFNDILIPGKNGEHIPLSELADIKIASGPFTIKSENARLTGFIFVDIENIDLGKYISNLSEKISTIKLPSGYSLGLVGQFEQMQKASSQLKIAVPLTLLIAVVLLYIHFNCWRRTSLIMLSVPFGIIGGFWSVYLFDYNMSVAVAVGFIALAGIAIETAIIMLMYIDQRLQEYPPKSLEDFVFGVKHGALSRLRPKMMTVSTIILGLVPIFLTEGPGADVIRRIALPMIGGMVSTTLLTLVVIPVLYVLIFYKKHK